MPVSRKPAWWYRQSGAVPIRRGDQGLEVLLVTNRSGRRWIVPKGIVERKLTPGESAEKEAWEEAGVRGVLSTEPLGTYRYEKWGGTCTVEVFLLDVEEISDRWPEPNRRRRWVGVEEAVQALREPELRALVARLREVLGREEERT
ncbi:MAG: NUDIX hydrolase [Deltaproteobacteria bacterium]|nr:NUDIX hydrolase [Deltaproteobacteria bacterium]